jgi:hypothetical protein
MERLVPAERVAKAAAVLDACRRRHPPVPEIEAVAMLARAPSRWREAHDAFRAIRKLTLLEEKRPTSTVYRALLFVAENAAKTVYNGCEPGDAFDEDCPYWLVRCAREMAMALSDAAFEDELWKILIDGWRGRHEPDERVVVS